ncbi:GH12 family glycosyl hydrolase domain-containing protein [Pendulispora albinea]|uniref:Uncharacterized protein n=1 Tax=Pendulispora albinea TaxID=2741071 RepID=A0ABZ2LWU6_9BACT
MDSGSTVGPCTNPVFTSSDPHEDHTFPNGYTVFNNVWSGSGGPQTIYACSPSSWYVVSNQPVLPDSRGEIKSYPCTQWMFNGRALNTLTAIDSTFAHTAPASGVWNASYDIWLGPGGWDIEVMLWTDYRYLATLPPGGNETDRPTIDGQPYIAWAEPDHKYIALAMTQKKTSGTVNFRHVFDWLVSKGWVPANAPLHAFEYGVEIAETNGPATFSVNDFSVTSR